VNSKELRIRICAGVVEVEQLPAGVRLVVMDYDVSGEVSVRGGCADVQSAGISVRGGCADVQSAPDGVPVRIVDET
jgi:hypothetical protein